MASAQEIPQIATELVEMTKEYLRQETLEPAKKLGKHAGMGFGGAFIMAAGAVCLAWAIYYGLQLFLPDGEWWVVLARGITAILSGTAAGIFAWRISIDSQQK
jgi:Putative Actinobacterial Holin-X, holin superfamily III